MMYKLYGVDKISHHFVNHSSSTFLFSYFLFFWMNYLRFHFFLSHALKNIASYPKDIFLTLLICIQSG